VTGFILLLFAALLPALLSFIVVRRAKRQFSERMRRIRALNNYRRRLDREFFPTSFDSLERYGDYIGDISCRNNAKSPYLRCAINPSGPCEDCSSYEKKH
jgi:hypothetical protein